MLGVGTWLNIIGYVTRSAPRRNRALGSEWTSVQAERSSVQAILVWSAGAVRTGDYERTLTQQYEMTKQLEMIS